MSEDLIQVTVKPTVDELKRRHKKRFDALKDMSTAYAKIAVYLDRWVQTNFKTEGGKVGGWLPFKYGGRLTTKKKGNAQAIANRRYIDGSAKLLQDTGRLKASYLPFSFRNNAGIGSDLPYAKKHEEGIDGVSKRRTLPIKKEVLSDTRKILDSEVSRITKL